MRTVTFKSVVDRIAGYLAEADGLSDEDMAIATSKINFFVRLGWQHYWWPETMDVEMRRFRPAYDSALSYAIHTEVFNPADGNYYQALRAVAAGQAPALLSGGGYTPNLAYWFPCQPCYGGSDYSATGTYAVGSIVRNPANNQFYGLYQLAHGVTVSGAGTAAANGDYVFDGTTYTSASGYTLNLISVIDSGTHQITGYFWNLLDPPGLNVLYQTVATSLPAPSVAGTWATVSGSDPAPTVVLATVASATPPFVAEYWTELTPFVRSIDYQQVLADGVQATPLGLVRFIWDRDPDIFPKACRQEFRLRRDFVQVLGCVRVMWVEFQGRAPVFTNTIYDRTEPVTAGTTLYDRATGDCWTTLVDVAASETPTSAPSKWSQVEFPYVLAEYVAQSAYAMMTDREQEMPENFTIQQSAGYPLLVVEVDNIERKQGQTRQLNVRSGRTGTALTPYSF